jgi:hypothetical protein
MIGFWFCCEGEILYSKGLLILALACNHQELQESMNLTPLVITISGVPICIFWLLNPVEILSGCFVLWGVTKAKPCHWRPWRPAS